MARPNRELQAAIDRFGATSGANSDQVAQLYAAIDADSSLLRSLNKEAEAGRLKGFAFHISTRDNLVGAYDIQSGMIMLPASGFREAGKEPSPNLAGALRIQDMSVRFAHSSYTDAANQPATVSQEMVDNLQRTINGSPVLADQMKAATAAGHLKQFAVMAPGTGAGGTYDGSTQTMNLPASSLQSKTAANPAGKFNLGSLTFVLGHETQHGFNHAEKQAAYRVFDSEVRKIARDSNPINDYTLPIEKLVQAGREDESKAEIAGWNAVLSSTQQIKPSVDLAVMSKIQVNQVRDFVDYDIVAQKASPKSGLVFNPDFSLSQTPENIAAMGRHYFDKHPDGTPGIPLQQTSSLGPHREADYPNYYGRNAIQRAITIDRKHAHSVDGVEPQMQINMAQLRLDERLIERLGLEIDPHPERRHAYYDASQSPPALRHFDHTETGLSRYEHVPIDPEILAGDVVNKDHAKPNPSQSGHPDHTLYSQIVAQVKEQDRVNGRNWDQVSERLSASLLSLAKENGVTRVDHVVFSQKTDHVAAGENVFIVQGRLDDPAHVRAHMKTEAAVQTPEAVSFQKVEALNERSAQQALNTQQNYQAQEEVQKSSGMSR